jgi:signal transduction histidine kinase/sensor domain CHASE-containing protein
MVVDPAPLYRGDKWVRRTVLPFLSPFLTPIAIAAAGVAVSISMWQAVSANDDSQISDAIFSQAQALQREFQVAVEYRSSALSRMAKRWEAGGGTPREQWEADAGAYIDDLGTYQAIEWVDPDFHVRWIVPFRGNEAAQDLDLAFEDRRRAALLESKESHERIVTRPIDLIQGGKGFLIYYPLYPEAEFDGFLLGVWRFDSLFRSIVGDDLPADFGLSVYDGEERIYGSPGSDMRLKERWGEEVALDLLGVKLSAIVWPNPQYLASQQSVLPEVSLGLVLLFTAMLVFVANTAQSAILRGRRLAQANSAIQSQTEQVAQFADETKIIAQVTRIVSSSPNIDHIFDQFRTETAKIVPFDRIVINHNISGVEMVDSYQWSAVEVPDRGRQEKYAIQGTLSEKAMTSKECLVVHPADLEEVERSYSGLSGAWSIGLRSFMSVPLISGGKAIGCLNLHSVTRTAYSLHHRDLIENVAAHIAGAISNALLFTDLKSAEERIAREAEELARSNSELEQFASVASHDLQEPVRKIQAFADRLKQVDGDVMSDRGRDYLDRIINAADRSRVLINDLLELSRISTNPKPFVVVNLNNVVDGVLSDLEPRIEREGGRVEVGYLPTVDADITQMRQLFQNLIGNALKFHRENEPPVVKVASTPAGDGHQVELTVEDNGIGFEAKHQERIFTIFQRLHGRSKYDGTGIGLAICKKIVERHGGTIVAESSVARGAKFTISLPITRQVIEKGTS